MVTEKQEKYWKSLRGNKGEKSPNWKGSKISKSAIHVWLNKTFGKPKLCEHCGRTDKQYYDWANTNNHIYRRVRDEFVRLCRSCHRKFDLTPAKKEKAEKNLWWSTGIKCPSIGNFKKPEDKKNVPCSVEGCEIKSKAHGLCQSHYYKKWDTERKMKKIDNYVRKEYKKT